MGKKEKIETFGVTLRRLREYRGFSQGELARKSDVDPSTISKWERSATEPGLRDVCSLAKALQVPVTALCPEDAQQIDAEPVLLDPDLQLFFSGDWQRLPTEAQEAIRTMIRIAKDLSIGRRGSEEQSPPGGLGSSQATPRTKRPGDRRS